MFPTYYCSLERLVGSVLAGFYEGRNQTLWDVQHHTACICVTITGHRLGRLRVSTWHFLGQKESIASVGLQLLEGMNGFNRHISLMYHWCRKAVFHRLKKKKQRQQTSNVIILIILCNPVSNLNQVIWELSNLWRKMGSLQTFLLQLYSQQVCQILSEFPGRGVHQNISPGKQNRGMGSEFKY